MKDENTTEARIGIVTVLYNSDDVLPGFFQSLARQAGVDFHLYVIDNSSSRTGTDLSEKLSQQHGIPATHVYNDSNLGVAKGNNQGIELALADGCSHVLLANNDLEFEDTQVIQKLLEALLDSQSSAAVPKIYVYAEDQMLWYAGGYFSRSKAIGYHIGLGERDQGQYQESKFVEYSPTCFMLINREAFSQIGNMDEQYFVYFDDTDFTWRMDNFGLKILYVPKAAIDHKVSSSTGGDDSPFSIFYMTRNRIYFIRKHFSPIRKTIAISWILATRPLRAMKMSGDQRAALWAGLKQGFRMHL